MSGLEGGGMLWQMIAGAGIVVKIILAGLFLLSIFSWAIILFKISALRKIEKETNSLYDLFWKNNDLSTVHAASKNYPATPLSKLIQEVYPEVALLIEAKEAEGASTTKTTKTKSDVMDVVKRLLKKTSSAEKAAMEKSVPFLATTGNTAPFIGLFGTVWGIMNTFSSIGMRGTANISTVAPG
ncbi:MAG: MotA/TolQ/ExbB proton channel family protein, partial [Thermodesulfobacteriota bacterium]